MSSKLLRDAGEALYGSRWQTEVAKALDISDRHIRRMAAGEADLSPGMAMDLWRLCLERASTLEAVSERLKAASTP